MPHYARRVDLNQSPIVETLRWAGARVKVCSDLGKGHPDLMVWWNDAAGAEQFAYAEVKSLTGKLTPAQRCWIEETGFTVAILRTVQEALSLVGREARAITWMDANSAQIGRKRIA
jgi:hypothetical protein